MNQRIRELADQCRVIVGEGIDGNIDYTEHFDEETFTNLILEEYAARAGAYAYMSPNFNALAEEIRSMKS